MGRRIRGGNGRTGYAGVIGENAPSVRDEVCEGLEILGIELNQRCNAEHAPLISPDSGRVKVRIIHSDEELMIARSVVRSLNLRSIQET
jgi:acetate kinase